MAPLEVLIRLGAGMLIGLIVGLEREYAQRPAGMRTHFLVALGAVAVTVAGEYIGRLYGDSDPLRLAAQVVSGIGFLGAGTILKEGANIRGLTTAASLWVTACLAIVAGTGMYFAAAAGTAGILVALTVMERVEKRMNAQQRITSAVLELDGDASAAIAPALTELLSRYALEPRGMSVENTLDGVHITVRLRARSRATLGSLVADASAIDGVRKANISHLDELG